MPRRVEPADDQYEAVCDNDGERYFVRYLLRHLPVEWEVYVQPPLNGRRPDVIVLHPDVGIGVFEVKDWNLDCYRCEQGRIIGASQGGEFLAANPAHQIQVYRKQVFDVLAPSLKIVLAENQNAFACVQVGVIFTHGSATTADARQLLHPLLSEDDRQYIAIVGRDTLERGAAGLTDVLRSARRTASRYFDPDIAEEFRRWIALPEAEREQLEPLDLTEQQRNIAETRTRFGLRRVRGAAGSGKSQALAARAAHLAMSGKSVLACAFNITMVNYLRDLAVRYRLPQARAAVRRNVHFTWFHQWCAEVIVALAGKDAWTKLFDGVDEKRLDHVLAVIVPAEVRRLAGVHRARLQASDDVLTYDAILVDEGQDWLPDWWNTVRLFLRRGGEMVLFADRTQDVYDRSDSWTEEAMTGAGFLGGTWIHLQGSHRVHPVMVPMLDDYVKRYIPSGEVPTQSQLELAFGRVHLYWVEAVGFRPGKLASAVFADLTALNEGRRISYPDCTVLVADHEDGLDLLADLDVPGAEVGHVFDEDTEVQRALKVKFRKGMGKLKASTVHSFKGWEDRALIVVVRKFETAEDRALVYTALSRVKRTAEGAVLIVLSYVPALAKFGAKWFQSLPPEILVPEDDIEF